MEGASNLFAAITHVSHCFDYWTMMAIELNSPAGTHLSALALKATDALLSPLGSHLRR